MKNIIKFIFCSIIFSLFFGCNAFKYEKVDTREVPTNAQDRARKNVEEGKGVSIGSLLKNNRNTNYEFSTSNPMWRASLEILDFLPMTTVDYSGGMIISDWYTDSTNKTDESIKISIRFLSNEVRSDSLKIIVHKKTCSINQNCKVILLDNSKISEELRSTIIRKAALLELESKNKKKK